MTYKLPHAASATERESRNSEVEQQKVSYQYSNLFAAAYGIKLLEQMPPAEAAPLDKSVNPAVEFQTIFDEVRAKMSTNLAYHAMNLDADIRGDTLGDLQALEDQLIDDPTLENISAYYDQLESVVEFAGSEKSVEEYWDLFANWDSSQVKNKSWGLFSDWKFALQAVAGPAATLIHRVSEEEFNNFHANGFPVTDDIFLQRSPFTRRRDTSLANMVDEGRLYMEDYSMLESIAGANPGAMSAEKRFMYSPRVLYALTNTRRPVLLPIAIQLRQNDRNPEHWDPIFVPHMPGAVNWGRYQLETRIPELEPSDYSWETAKIIARCANQMYHEMFKHLGQTHLLIESFIASTHRTLPSSHPVFAILKPHFLGTVNINHFARQVLISDTGLADRYASTKIEDFRAGAASSIRDQNLRDLYQPQDLESRDVDDLPYYPYRDDSLLLWDAIRQYAEEFLCIYYTDEDQFRRDMDTENGGELGRWWNELTQPLTLETANVTVAGLKLGKLEQLEDLYDVVTFIIYTSSVQHAAVNFPQGDYYTNVAANPATVSRPTPVPGNTNRDYFLETLPPKTQSLFQMNLMFVLSALQFTRLGKFADSDFTDTRVVSAVSNFQLALEDIEQTIVDRNASLWPALKYEYLRPSRIPQSANV